MRTRIIQSCGLEQLEERRLFAGLVPGSDVLVSTHNQVLIPDGGTVLLGGLVASVPDQGTGTVFNDGGAKTARDNTSTNGDAKLNSRPNTAGIVQRWDAVPVQEGGRLSTCEIAPSPDWFSGLKADHVDRLFAKRNTAAGGS